MRIILNNETIALSDTAVADLIAQTSPQKPFIIAVDIQFVAEDTYVETALNENDKVGTVRPMVGGQAVLLRVYLRYWFNAEKKKRNVYRIVGIY